ncbi:MAG: radical SAM protein [Bacteroidetes bacterium]|nr:MAG: radical SAM protein [Bacteroidota bacterium]REK04767.1 MAG: radical SAM protein [Bacteroidota bacterium]REK36241.1 MAG: radical SAM protein [Bacteroidota bacterium]REK51097.1 MAG: radical SAM protein [Bacteroidota bacterium]
MISTPKILLSHGYFLHEDPKEQEIMKPYPPLGILYISAYLKKSGFENKIFDSTFSTFDELIKHVTIEKPDILALYTNLMTKRNVLRVIKAIKHREDLKDIRIILGGPELRHNAENFLRFGADILVIGEGEQTMLELVEQYSRNDDSIKALSKIDGIAYLNEKGELKLNPERKFIKNPDELPIPNREGIDLTLYLKAWKERHGYNAISVSTMRGCPYTCKWCSRAVYGQSYRRRSPAHVVNEIKQLQNRYEFETIWFVDDVFNISHKWLTEFRDELIRQGVNIRYECITRADRMNTEVIQYLKESGCYRVWIGAESGSQKILDAMNRRVKAEEVREMIRESKRQGLETGTFIMLGYPGETEEDIEETINHLSESSPDYYTITVAYPIKGTDLYLEVEQQQLHQISFEKQNDRDRDFKRTYPRKYYDFAVRRIFNELEYRKLSSVNGKKFFRVIVHRIKSVLAKSAMIYYRIVS